MPVQSIRSVVEAAIQSASNATGVDFTFLLGTARRESGYNPTAKAPTSSAAGLFQFTDQTWLATLKKFGARHGYARYAELITQGADGRFHPVSAEARQAVMNLRLDAKASALMAGELTADHASYLRGRVGRNPTAGELYVAHFLGPAGSARLIEAARSNPTLNAAAMFPDAAHANRTIFYRDGRPATVAEVYANLTSNPQGSGAVRERAPEPADDSAFVQYASARRMDRLREERAMVDLVLRGPEPLPMVPTAEASNGGAGSAARLTGSMFTTEMLRVLAEARGRDGGG
ncbi:MAG TPA: transglycosylase SLT domain-containing protein [Caulobacteraceae bacterium]|nr:transglycosylase SLT domain-containing protein [Caulobacteraceae bacterium]